MRHNLALFCCLVAAPLLAAPPKDEPVLMRIDLGGALGFNFNSTTSQYTTTETRLGLGMAANMEFHLVDFDIAFLVTLMRNQLLGQSQDGASNSEICKEGFGTKLIGLPGPCGQLQLRMQPMLWIGNWGGGMSFTFNHIANYTYKEEIVYNTKWNYLALGAIGAYRVHLGKLTLIPAVHFDYGIDSSSMVAQKLTTWQMGVNVYAIYAVF